MVETFTKNTDHRVMYMIYTWTNCMDVYYITLDLALYGTEIHPEQVRKVASASFHSELWLPPWHCWTWLHGWLQSQLKEQGGRYAQWVFIQMNLDLRSTSEQSEPHSLLTRLQEIELRGKGSSISVFQSLCCWRVWNLVGSEIKSSHPLCIYLMRPGKCGTETLRMLTQTQLNNWV